MSWHVLHICPTPAATPAVQLAQMVHQPTPKVIEPVAAVEISPLDEEQLIDEAGRAIRDQLLSALLHPARAMTAHSSVKTWTLSCHQIASMFTLLEHSGSSASGCAIASAIFLITNL